MDIKDLNKTQLILLTLLITFVVSIATGIITVSLMQQMPKSVPQTINNVIQRTIERVTTVPSVVPTVLNNTTNEKQPVISFGDGDVIVPIYSVGEITTTQVSNTDNSNNTSKELGQGIIISDVGLILVESSILTDKELYRVVLNKIDFDATLLKKFTNGFTILKINSKKIIPSTTTPVINVPSTTTPTVDKVQ